MTNADNRAMFVRTNLFAKEFRQILEARGIQYDKLKTALIPSVKKKDIALIFDSTLIVSKSYGYYAYELVLGQLDKKSNNSFLSGDFLDGEIGQEILYEMLLEQTQNIKSNFRHSTQYYIIYITNVSNALLNRLRSIMPKESALVDVLDLTFASRFKEYLSFILGTSFIKCGKYVIQADPDGKIDSPNINTVGHPFEDYGLTNISVPALPFGLFLQYKIERHLSGGDDEDREFSINAISPHVSSLDDLNVYVEKPKLEYLKNEKGGVLKKIDSLGLTENDLAALIRSKIKHNYIFNLEFDKTRHICKFNTIVEVQSATKPEFRQKVLVALDYLPQSKTLRLITLY